LEADVYLLYRADKNTRALKGKPSNKTGQSDACDTTSEFQQALG